MKVCPKGHPLKGRNAMERPNGQVKCRQCHNDGNARYRAKQDAKVPRCPTCGRKMKGSR